MPYVKIAGPLGRAVSSRNETWQIKNCAKNESDRPDCSLLELQFQIEAFSALSSNFEPQEQRIFKFILTIKIAFSLQINRSNRKAPLAAHLQPSPRKRVSFAQSALIEMLPTLTS